MAPTPQALAALQMKPPLLPPSTKDPFAVVRVPVTVTARVGSTKR